MKVSELSAYINTQLTERSVYAKAIRAANDRIEELEQESIQIQKLRTVLTEATEKTQDQVRFHLSNLVTTGLQTVFPEKNYKFHVDFVSRRNQIECDLLIEDNEVLSKPIYRNGGGVMDLLSLSLRVGRWSLSESDPVMVLDEPSKFVSEDKQQYVLELMKTLSETLGIQWIVVTHLPALGTGADKVIEVVNGSIKQGDSNERKNEKKKKRKRKRKKT